MRIALFVPAGEATPVSVQGPDLTRYLVVCALAILFVLGAAALFRRFAAQHLRARAAKRSLQVLDVLPLGGKQKLVVVRCYDRSFLLGLGEKEVRSIAELDRETAALPVRTETAGVPFPDALERELGPLTPARSRGRGAPQETPIPREGVVA